MTEQDFMNLLQRGCDIFRAVYEDWQLEAGSGHWQEAEDWLKEARKLLERWYQEQEQDNH